MSIKIGNNNKISKSTISENCTLQEEKKNFNDKHPILCGILISVIAGLILMFSFWEPILKFIESIFGG